MKTIVARLFGILILFLFSCTADNKRINELQAKIDNLQKQLNETYKPGFGELMSGIQVHHAKLWFAGQNSNWPLADFEVHEMKEGLEDIEKFCSDRKEAKEIAMINAPMDSVENAIAEKNESLFKSSFILLTNGCNNCHKATGHEFNNVTIPTIPPLSNQSFRPVQ